MSCRRSRFTALLILAVCTAFRAIPAPPEVAPKPATTPSVVLTNSVLPVARPDGLREVEKSLLGPLEAISPRSSLDGVSAAPVHPLGPPPSLNQKAREDMERRKDWVFMTPEQLIGAPSADELAGIPNKDKDNRKQKASPLDAYIERLYNPEKKQKRTKSTDFEILANPGLKASARAMDVDDDSDNVPKNIRESETTLKSLFAPGDQDKNAKRDAKSPGLFSDIFGLGKSAHDAPTREELEKERLHKEELRQLFGLPAPPIPGFASPNSLSGLANQFGLSSSPAPAAKPLDSMSGVPHQSFDSTLGVLTMPALPQLTTLPQPSAILTQPSLTPSLPKQEPPRIMPPTPNFNAPRRQF